MAHGLRLLVGKLLWQELKAAELIHSQDAERDKH